MLFLTRVKSRGRSSPARRVMVIPCMSHQMIFTTLNLNSQQLQFMAVGYSTRPAKRRTASLGLMSARLYHIPDAMWTKRKTYNKTTRELFVSVDVAAQMASGLGGHLCGITNTSCAVNTVLSKNIQIIPNDVVVCLSLFLWNYYVNYELILGQA